jgi:hypothetical protein
MLAEGYTINSSLSLKLLMRRSRGFDFTRYPPKIKYAAIIISGTFEK